MIVLGVLLLAAAAVVAVVGALHNHGAAHPLGGRVDILGYHLTGSTGKLLLTGVIIGAVGMLGLALIAAGSRRQVALRRSLRQERRAMRAIRSEDSAPREIDLRDRRGFRGRHRSEPTPTESTTSPAT